MLHHGEMEGGSRMPVSSPAPYYYHYYLLVTIENSLAVPYSPHNKADSSPAILSLSLSVVVVVMADDEGRLH